MSNGQEAGSSKRTLALDTSTANLAVAVMEGREVLHATEVSAERNHSVHVISLLKEVLQESGTSRAAVEGIAVGVGPGSYTGTRIAVTAAKTLALAWKVPVVGISSLQALAWGGLEQAAGQGQAAYEWIVPIMDARRKQVYTALFAANGSKPPARLEKDAIRLMGSWVAQLKESLEAVPVEERPQRLIIVGDIQLHAEAAEELRELMGDQLILVAGQVEGRFVGRIGAELLLSGQSDELHSLVPNYTQLAEAEANLLRNS